MTSEFYLKEATMSEEALKARTLSYIMKRQCQTGGFCFYRLEEPNGSDTYYALATLRLLGKPFKEKSTILFLKDIQNHDGSYKNIYHAYYAIKGLGLMDETPKLDPRPYIRSSLHNFMVKHAALGTILRRMNILTELCSELHITIPVREHTKMIDFVLSCQNDDGGFGSPFSTLLNTSYSLSVIERLHYPFSSLGISRFLEKCKNPVHGFLNIPNMAPSFLEHIHAGVLIASILDYPTFFVEACLNFIKSCQSTNGGFSRAPKGLPTLQDTYYAIHSLTQLTKMA